VRRQAATGSIPAPIAATFAAAFTAIATAKPLCVVPATALPAIYTVARTELPTLTFAIPVGPISIGPAEIISVLFTSQLAGSPPNACLGAGSFRLLLLPAIFFAAAKRPTDVAKVLIV